MTPPFLHFHWSYDRASNLVHQYEVEEQDVMKMADLDMEVPHLAFGNRDRTRNDYNKGDVDIVPLDGADEQHLIDHIMSLAQMKMTG